MSGNSRARSLAQFLWRYGFILALTAVFILYVATLAQVPVFGDPTEYTFVAHILGIAHPPGYAFITVLGKLFQLLVPLGTIAWRMHLLAAVAATLGLFFVYGTTRIYTQYTIRNTQHAPTIAALFAALTVGTSANYWQHAIHANPHIITAVFLTANLFFLTKWWASARASDKVTRWQGDKVTFTPSPGHLVTLSNKWLYAFSLSAGLGVTHHPLTVMGFLAYAAFIVGVRPSILRDWKTILKMLLFALLGLSVWLYFPIRSPMKPAFGPSTMNTLNGFLDHVLARGLTESLPYFTLAEQPGRALVFWTLLRLQYSLPVIALALVPLGWGIKQAVTTRANWRQWSQSPLAPLFLYGLTFLSFYAFIFSLRAQDIMAYANGLFLMVGLMAGIGLFFVLRIAYCVLIRFRHTPYAIRNTIIALAFLAGPIWQVTQNAPRISLREYDTAQVYVEDVFSYFAGQGAGAVLLNDWEHMTPLWYAQFVDGRWPDEADVRPEFISTGGENPWLEAIFNYLPGGPVYLSSFRPSAIAGTEFRLRPAGPFYQVVEPGDTSIPPELTPLTAVGGDVEVVGYEWEDTAVTAGDYIPLTLALRTPNGTDDYYVPILTVGDLRYEFTTDSHLISPNWYPGEVIVERFDFALPHDLPAGNYPVTLNLKNLSADEEYALNVPLGELQVAAQTNPPGTSGLLANFRQRVGLRKAWVGGNGRLRPAPWDENGPVTARPGDVINLILQWESLAPAEESYTVFVHLIDAANQPWLALDYTPLGGSAPTHLWIPKWLPGQKMLDPYRLPLPADLPPGTYFIEVGLYDMTSGRRLHISDANGDLNGDRVILGTVIVQNN